MSIRNVLLQLDTDPAPSAFDSIVAVDSPAEVVLRYGGVTPDQVESLVHGAIFTRGGDDLRHTALFLGGSDVVAVESLLSQAVTSFFGPFQVSLMTDPNGSNTTAAAAVLSAMRHRTLRNQRVLVMGGTGPVGLRVGQLAAREGARVTLVSRNQERADLAADSIDRILGENGDDSGLNRVAALAIESPQAATAAVGESDIVFSAGAAGVELVPEDWQALAGSRVLIDLNAVPPAGIGGIGVGDKGREVGDSVVYGAIGVGGLKMKIHKKCLARLFESNDQRLDTSAIFAVGKELVV